MQKKFSAQIRPCFYFRKCPVLTADKSQGSQHQQYFPDNNLGKTSKEMVHNAATYDGRYGRVYQYPKFAWNIHGFTPLFSIQFQSVIPAILIYLFTILRA